MTAGKFCISIQPYYSNYTYTDKLYHIYHINAINIVRQVERLHLFLRYIRFHNSKIPQFIASASSWDSFGQLNMLFFISLLFVAVPKFISTMKYKILVLLITRATQGLKFQSSNPLPVVRTVLKSRDAKKITCRLYKW